MCRHELYQSIQTHPCNFFEEILTELRGASMDVDSWEQEKMNKAGTFVTELCRKAIS